MEAPGLDRGRDLMWGLMKGTFPPFYLYSKKDLTLSNGVLEVYNSPATTAFRNKSQTSNGTK